MRDLRQTFGDSAVLRGVSLTVRRPAAVDVVVMNNGLIEDAAQALHSWWGGECADTWRSTAL